jgi:histidinol-phosphate aminotransferase
LERVKAYCIPRAPGHIDLNLGGTERPIVEDEDLLPAGFGAADQCRYPDPRELERLLAERLGVSPGQVMITAGADETLDRTCRAMLGPGRKMILSSPTFEMLGHYGELTGATLKAVPWSSGDFPVEAALAEADRTTSIIAVVSPNNPTGAVASAGAVQRLARGAPQALILVDMAYGEYAELDLFPAVKALPNVLVARTLSKAWGGPGLRVGYAVAAAPVIGWLRTAGGPYSVSALALRAARDRLLSRGAETKSYVARVREERKALRAMVGELGGEAEPSQANFILARFGSRAPWVRQALSGLGIGVRVFPSNPSLADALRITCPGKEDAFDRLAGALRTSLRPQAILFDMDGVLADVSRSFRAAIRATALSYGVRLTSEEIAAAKALGNANNDWVLTLRLLQARGVIPSLAEVTDRFEAIYQGTKSKPGLWAREKLIPPKALLSTLGRRVRIGIVTGRPRRDAERFLACTGMKDCIGAMVCMEEGPLKPDPAPVRLCLERLGLERAWLVGDTVDDIRAARGARVVPIGIPAPGDDPEETRSSLFDAGAATVLESLDELEELLP